MIHPQIKAFSSFSPLSLSSIHKLILSISLPLFLSLNVFFSLLFLSLSVCIFRMTTHNAAGVIAKRQGEFSLFRFDVIFVCVCVPVLVLLLSLQADKMCVLHEMKWNEMYAHCVCTEWHSSNNSSSSNGSIVNTNRCSTFK